MKLQRVIVADDHTLVAEALRCLIAPHFDVVAIATDGHELIEVATSLKPDAVVVDVAMPLLNGLEAGRQLKAQMQGVKLIFLTMNEDPELAVEAMRAGASGYVLKTSAGSELVQAIRAGLEGKSYITPQIARGMEDSSIRGQHGKSQSEFLTRRVRQVIQLLAEGKSMKEAASVLNISVRTISFHKYRIMRRLGLKTNSELVRFGIEQARRKT